jgi:hypothetical protein
MKLINSSVGTPVSFDHHESVEVFPGVSLTVIFTASGVGRCFYQERRARVKLRPIFADIGVPIHRFIEHLGKNRDGKARTVKVVSLPGILEVK